MGELKGIGHLRKKLSGKRTRVLLRYEYYEMKNAMKDFKITMPPEFGFLKEVLGWCSKAADSMADRLVFRDFGDDSFDLNEIFSMNSRDVLFDTAILSAAICCRRDMPSWKGMARVGTQRWRPISCRALLNM